MGAGRSVVAFPKKQIIFRQGNASDTVFYVRKAKLNSLSCPRAARKQLWAYWGKEIFSGKAAWLGSLCVWVRRAALVNCELLQIDKKAMMLAVYREHAFPDLFVAYLLARNIRYEEDLVDQLFNSSEKRLARILLLLAHFGKDGVPQTVIPKISQETLAEMIGTTRSRVSFFTNRFRKLGFVDYDTGNDLQIHSSLLNIVLHD